MAAKSYKCGVFTVDVARREVYRADTRLELPAKVFDCVSYLIEHRDRAVGRDELIAAVWGRVDISDNLLAQIVLRARRAFDDDAEAQRYIRTITGFGYRWVYDFDADVELEVPPLEVAQSVTAPSLALSRSTGAAPARFRIALPTVRGPTVWKVLVIAFVALILIRVGTYFASTGPGRAGSAPSKDLVFVLPAIVRDAPDFAWARLGVMDLIAQRLREAGQATVPSDTVVAVANFAGERPTAAELGELSRATGAQAFLQPELTRDQQRWRVALNRLVDAKVTVSYTGVADDPVQATSAAIAQLTTALNLSPLPYNEGSGPGATLALQVTSELLQDRLGEARALIDAAPADVRDDPRVRLQSAAVDYFQSRLTEAEATLEKLDAEPSKERSPEFNARVTTALAMLQNRNGNYASGERIATQAIDSVKNLDQASVGNVLGSALMTRAIAHVAQGAFDKATDDFAASRAALTMTGNMRTLALLDSNFAMMQMERDRLGEAVVGLTKSADYFRRLGAPIRELLDRNKLAVCHLALQDFAAAAAEDAKLAELITRVEDPEVRNAAKGLRAEIALALGRTADADAIIKALLTDPEVSDLVRGPALLVDARLATERGDPARAMAAAHTGLGLKWAEEQPREYATTWLLLVRADRKAAPAKSADDAARARAWASSSIYPSAALLIDLLEAEQLAARGQDNPARAAFERALRATSEHEVPVDVVEVTTSYANWLLEKKDFERAVAVLGRNQGWSASNFRVAVAEARLYRMLGNEKLWRAALDRAQQSAGERGIPQDISRFEPAKAAAATTASELAAR